MNNWLFCDMPAIEIKNLSSIFNFRPPIRKTLLLDHHALLFNEKGLSMSSIKVFQKSETISSSVRKCVTYITMNKIEEKISNIRRKTHDFWYLWRRGHMKTECFFHLFNLKLYGISLKLICIAYRKNKAILFGQKMKWYQYFTLFM